MSDFAREHHRVIARLLGALDGAFLARCNCYFGGGTMLTLLLGEYRESRAIDFLCANRAGYRALREAVQADSLGGIQQHPVQLAREIRADRDGIRTVLAEGDARIIFEVVLEARIDLDGALDERLGVPVLSFEHAAAEKLLANADRGLDRATLGRDLVDLAFLAEAVDGAVLRAGAARAVDAYGKAIPHVLQLTLDQFQNDRAWANRCIQGLAIEDTRTLRAGLKALRRLASQLG